MSDNGQRVALTTGGASGIDLVVTVQALNVRGGLGKLLRSVVRRRELECTVL